MRRLPARLMLLTLPLLWGFDWPGRLETLRRAMERADAEGRAALLEHAVRTSGAASLRPLLHEALQDPAPHVQRVAAEALLYTEGTLPLASALRWLASDEPEQRLLAIRALPRRPEPEAFEALCRALSDPSPTLRAEVAERLPLAIVHEAERGPTARRTLLARLEDPIPLVRRAVVRALGRLGDPSTLMEVASRLADPDDRVRREVPGVLALLGGGAAAPPLRAALQSEDPVLRLEALAALGRLGDPRQRRWLLPFVRHTDTRIATTAIHALGRLPGAEATEDLLSALAEASERHVGMAPRTKALREALLRRMALGEAERVETGLVGWLRSSSNPARVTAAASLLREAGRRMPWQRPDAAPLLLALDSTTSEHVRSVLLRALGEARASERSLLALLEGLSAPSADMQRAARQGLARSLPRRAPEERIVEPLVEALRHTNSEAAKRELLSLLGHAGEAAFDALLPWLRSSEPSLREAAALSLSEAGGPPGTLQRIVTSHPWGSVRLAAAVALGRSEVPWLPDAALRRIASPQPSDRHAWLLALVVHVHRRPRLTANLRSSLLATLREALEAAGEEDALLALSGLVHLPSERVLPVLREVERPLAAHPALGPALRRALGALGAPPPAPSDPEAMADWLAGLALSPRGGSARALRQALANLRAPWPVPPAAAAVLARAASLPLSPSARHLPCRLLREGTDPVLLANLALWAARRPERCAPGRVDLLAKRLRASRSRILARALADALWRLWRGGEEAARRPLRRCLEEVPPPLLAEGCWPSEESSRPASLWVTRHPAHAPSPVGWYVLRVGDAWIPVRLRPQGRLVPEPSAPRGPRVRLLSLPAERPLSPSAR